MDTTKNSEQELLSKRDSFIATLGHDLKNPIIAQIKSLELLLKGSFGDIKKEQQEILQIILDSCKYMNSMLSSLLATYRNYGSVIRLDFETFSFTELINECVSEMFYVAKDKNINICLYNKSNIETIQADRVQIKRVIMNLLSNGIKYGFRNTELKLLIQNTQNKIGFEFINKSPYIPVEKQSTIFDQYVSYATTYKENGIGLGLYASKKIIEGHSGEIFVKSYNDNRNSFGFRIPIVQKDILTDKIIQF